jgi:hypothetical protein
LVYKHIGDRDKPKIVIYLKLSITSSTDRNIALLIKQQFVTTHTICQTENPAVPESWPTNMPSVKVLVYKESVKFFLSPVKLYFAVP